MAAYSSSVAHRDGSRMLKAALKYAQQSIPVFPIRSRGKEPITPHGFKDATTDEAQIHQWWGSYPEANIAIPTGAQTGLLVFDIDPRNGGTDSLEELIHAHGRFPDTAEQETGGGGRHIFFRYKGGPVPKNLAPGIDLKGDGGYIVVPPSVHPSGKTYVWDGLKGWRALLNPAELPEWLKKFIGASCKVEVIPGGRALETKIAMGHRNNSLASLAGSMRHRGMSPEAIEAALVAEN